MALVNEHFLKLASNYLFADIAKKVKAYKIAHPKQQVISLGIGDVTQPLCPAVIKAMHKAVDEMAVQASFRGYGPERGYDFLREAIIKNDFLPRGIHLDVNEVFVNDGAKSDTGNIQEILRWDNNIGVTDPIYPVYIDSNVMIGRAGVFENGRWSNVTYMPCNDGNDFTPQIPDHRVDMIYLCYPNNPTGTVITKEELRSKAKLIDGFIQKNVDDDRDNFMARKQKADGTSDLEERLNNYIVTERNNAVNTLAKDEDLDVSVLNHYLSEYDYLQKEQPEIIQEALKEKHLGLIKKRKALTRILDKLRSIIRTFSWE